MEIGYSQSQAQRVLKQRNMLALVSLGLGAVAIVSLIAASSRDREVVLQPILTRQVTLDSAGVSKDYLELCTRDAAVLMLNRSPSSVDYWMEQVLRIVHPSAYGRMKGELLKLVNDQRGSSMVQFFTIESMKVDPAHLTSEVTGVLHTMVGNQEVGTLKRTFRFEWAYTGVELRLTGFGAMVPTTTADTFATTPLSASTEAAKP